MARDSRDDIALYLPMLHRGHADAQQISTHESNHGSPVEYDLQRRNCSPSTAQGT
jgi:hypothetical protein